MVNYLFSHLLSGILGASLALSYPTGELQLKEISTKVLSILEKIEQPSLKTMVEASQKNMDYLMNAEPFGIKNGVPKIGSLAVLGCLTYYGYKKYQENQKLNNCNNDIEKNQ
jgi:hypothetical protein